jgi:hypothetical protein
MKDAVAYAVPDRSAVSGDAVSCAEVLRKRATPQDGKHRHMDGAESTDELVRRSRFGTIPAAALTKTTTTKGHPGRVPLSRVSIRVWFSSPSFDTPPLQHIQSFFSGKP